MVPGMISRQEDCAAQASIGYRHGVVFQFLARTDSLARQAARLPITKCRIKEITANRSNKWIRPPATWKTVKPPIHAISSTTNKIVQMLICFSFPLPKLGNSFRSCTWSWSVRNVLQSLPLFLRNRSLGQRLCHVIPGVAQILQFLISPSLDIMYFRK